MTPKPCCMLHARRTAVDRQTQPMLSEGTGGSAIETTGNRKSHGWGFTLHRQHTSLHMAGALTEHVSGLCVACVEAAPDWIKSALRSVVLMDLSSSSHSNIDYYIFLG